METWGWAEDSLSRVKISTTGSSVNSVLETAIVELSKKPSAARWCCAKVVKEAAGIY